MQLLQLFVFTVHIHIIVRKSCFVLFHQIDQSTTVLADAQVTVESAQMQLPSLVQQGVAHRLQNSVGGCDKPLSSVPPIAELIPIVP